MSMAPARLNNVSESVRNLKMTPRYALEVVLKGQEYVATYPGTSQYSQGTSSACGIAALNCLRLVLDKEVNGILGDELLELMMKRPIIDEIVSICTFWTSDAHLEVDEVQGIPLFQASLNLVSSDYGKPGVEKFRDMLSHLEQLGRSPDGPRSRAVVITRPPEIIVCMKIAHPVQDVFAIFDSHPRPKHPDGAAFIFNTSLSRTAQYLADLLQFDESLLDAKNGLQWQAQLLANVSGHFFESTHQDVSKKEHVSEVILDSNLGMLAMKAEINKLKSDSSFLASENKRLEEKIATIEREREEWKAERARYKGKDPVRSSANYMLSEGESEKVASSRHPPASSKWPSTAPQSSSRLDFNSEPSPVVMNSSEWDGHVKWKQDETERWPRDTNVNHARTQLSWIKSESTQPRPEYKMPGIFGSSNERSVKPSVIDDDWDDVDSATDVHNLIAEEDPSIRMAYETQRQYDLEDARLRSEHSQLVKDAMGGRDRPSTSLLSGTRKLTTKFMGALHNATKPTEAREKGRVFDEPQPIIMLSSDWDGNGFGAQDASHCSSSRQTDWNAPHYHTSWVQQESRLSARRSVNPEPTWTKKPGKQEQHRLDYDTPSDMSGVADPEVASALYAAEMQRRYEEEDASLRSEQTRLLKTAQTVFECGVCMEQLPEDSLARVDGCTHSFCRDCMRQYASSKIKDHRYPIVCPVCLAQGGVKDPGTITDQLMLQIGLTEDEYRVYEELSLARFSTLVHCRKCKRTTFVDREEYEEASIIACPLPGCNHLWCKSCQQAVPIGGPKHSCDGTSELDHLMNQRGWKYCPGCKTPTEKSSGCNHMTCFSPGCNTHFCYICGSSIVQSAMRQEIQTAVSAHYRTRCDLFVVPPDE